MRSQTLALIWELWRRNRRFAWLALGCVSFSALVNSVASEHFRTRSSTQGLFSFLMVWSFLFVFGFFNYTETTTTREWNGFPYRMFLLPVRTWRLVALPLLSGVAIVELVYAAWMKLVWTHDQVLLPGWFAVVLGAYMVFYQTALWSLAGLRTMRVLILSVGGTSSIAVACLPLFNNLYPSAWLSINRLTVILIGLAILASLFALAVVSRQRSGGGRRQSWWKIKLDRVLDLIPRRVKDFATPAGAQFWFEWRRAGWLLPVCLTFALIFLVAPIAWFNRKDPAYVSYIFARILIMPIILAFVIGKGFIKPEFWSTDLALSSFQATRPLRAGDFIICKMKVAALSVLLAWLSVLAFITLWISLCADTEQLARLMYLFRALYPHSSPVIILFSITGLVVFSWRCLIGGLWTGLAGQRWRYLGSLALQGGGVVLLLIAIGVFSDSIDAQIHTHPDVIKSLIISIVGWTLALLVIFKMWFAVFAWRKIAPRRAAIYLLAWSSLTLCFVVLGALATPWADTYRVEHLFVLAACLLVPFARLGMAPSSLAKNRHR